MADTTGAAAELYYERKAASCNYTYASPGAFLRKAAGTDIFGEAIDRAETIARIRKTVRENLQKTR